MVGLFEIAEQWELSALLDWAGCGRQRGRDQSRAVLGLKNHERSENGKPLRQIWRASLQGDGGPHGVVDFFDFVSAGDFDTADFEKSE